MNEWVRGGGAFSTDKEWLRSIHATATKLREDATAAGEHDIALSVTLVEDESRARSR